ncbi:hypothetical protein J7E70_27545 [Variovorax paradoxus]|nr:hypothetical protein [Variovorax paradoxus]MBT2304194.1 hypothetical protein [Variovorax paradoxus]
MPAKAASHTWTFRASFRRRAFGWSGTRKAIERLNEALGEFERMVRTEPALAGQGAVLLLEKLSPAVGDIDSSSGALGNATTGVVEKRAPLTAAAPVPRSMREKWLERLFNAIQEDDPYIESLGAHWGALCADPALSLHWADQLLPLMQHLMADRRRGIYAYARSGTLRYSALSTPAASTSCWPSWRSPPNHTGMTSNGLRRRWPRVAMWMAPST